MTNAMYSIETVNGRTVEIYTMTIEPTSVQIYPNLGPANMVGYNGTVPGPTFKIKKDTETIIRFLNKGTESAAVHLHGSYTHAVWDGWASEEMEVGQWKDYYYPNSESARSIWYHDHADGHTALDAYYGQAGLYIIYDPDEDYLGLPSGDYDVALSINDKSYQANGDLQAPNNNPINFFGDVIQVNNQPWPFLAVEPRKYRFRIYDTALSRTFQLYFTGSDGEWIEFQVIGSDSGLFGGPVSTNDLTIAMGERYEIVIDFANYAGQNITLGNNMQQQQIVEYDNTDKIMRFVVGESVSDWSNNGDVPSTLNPNIQWPAARTTVDHTFNFQMGGEDTWTINGITFNDPNNRVLARPPQGTVELWEVHHTGYVAYLLLGFSKFADNRISGPAVHPIHIHLVNLQVVSRTGGSRGVLPYEAAGLKDVVLLEPGETVRVLAYYGPWNGLYMYVFRLDPCLARLLTSSRFHCHNLVHEDHAMMDVFNVTKLEALGYEFDATTKFSDPNDSKFVAQDFTEDAFAPEVVRSAALSLASLGAYADPTSIIAAHESYYATAGYHGDASSATTTTTVVPSSSGYGFATTTATASLTITQAQKGNPYQTAAPSHGPPGGFGGHRGPGGKRSLPFEA